MNLHRTALRIFSLPVALFGLSCRVIALKQSSFNELITALQQQQSETVAAHLKDSAETAVSDPSYSILLLNHAVTAGCHRRLVESAEEAKPGERKPLRMHAKNCAAMNGRNYAKKYSMREEVFFATKAVTVIQEAQANLESFLGKLDIHFGIAHLSDLVGRLDLQASLLIDMLRALRVINDKWQGIKSATWTVLIFRAL